VGRAGIEISLAHSYVHLEEMFHVEQSHDQPCPSDPVFRPTVPLVPCGKVRVEIRGMFHVEQFPLERRCAVVGELSHIEIE